MFETGVDGNTVTKAGKKNNLCMDFKMILTDFGKVPDFEKQVCIGLVIYCTEVSSGGPDTGGQRADAGSDSWKKNDLGK